MIRRLRTNGVDILFLGDEVAVGRGEQTGFTEHHPGLRSELRLGVRGAVNLSVKPRRNLQRSSAGLDDDEVIG